MEPEQIKQLTSMIKSDDHDNLVVAMAIIFNLSDEQADSKTELYKLVIEDNIIKKQLTDLGLIKKLFQTSS